MNLNETIKWIEGIELDCRSYADELETISLEEFAKGMREKAENVAQVKNYLMELKVYHDGDLTCDSCKYRDLIQEQFPCCDCRHAHITRYEREER